MDLDVMLKGLWGHWLQRQLFWVDVSSQSPHVAGRTTDEDISSHLPQGAHNCKKQLSTSGVSDSYPKEKGSGATALLPLILTRHLRGKPYTCKSSEEQDARKCREDLGGTEQYTLLRQ